MRTPHKTPWQLYRFVSAGISANPLISTVAEVSGEMIRSSGRISGFSFSTVSSGFVSSESAESVFSGSDSSFPISVSRFSDVGGSSSPGTESFSIRAVSELLSSEESSGISGASGSGMVSGSDCTVVSGADRSSFPDNSLSSAEFSGTEVSSGMVESTGSVSCSLTFSDREGETSPISSPESSGNSSWASDGSAGSVICSFSATGPSVSEMTASPLSVSESGVSGEMLSAFLSSESGYSTSVVKRITPDPSTDVETEPYSVIPGISASSITISSSADPRMNPFRMFPS